MVGRAIVVAALACLLGGPASARAEDDWSDVWDALAAWRTSGAQGEPQRARELAVGRGDTLRSALLSALVGGPTAGAALQREFELLPPDDPWPLTARESWLAAEALPPGAVCSRTVVAAMERTPGSLSPEQTRLAHRLGVEAAEDLRLEEALAIQDALHARVGAEWSAFNLALSLRRMGLYQRADRILEEQLGVAASADLYSQRGLNALGSGNEARARTLFGAALARGSRDAAAVLARLDLAEGRLDTARSGFRALLANEDPGAWALRGWGVAQVASGALAGRRQGPRDRSKGAPAVRWQHPPCTLGPSRD
jgi:tetratricopeptide (TPR) repeat protein